MTSAPPRPAVTDALLAIGKGCLHHLCPADQSRLLAAQVARAEAGAPVTLDDERAAARLIRSLRAHLAGPLAAMGVAIPDEPQPAARATTTSEQAKRVTRAKVLEGGRIGIRSPFALQDLIRALPGCKRGAGWAIWTVPATPAAAHALLTALAPFGFEVSRGVQQLADNHVTAQDARALLADGAPVPENDGTDVVMMPLWTHQRRAVAWAETTDALVLAIKMGGGKTGAAIAAVNRVQAATVLIVCPNRVRAVWTREVRERSAVAWHIEDGTRAARRRGARRQDLPHPERVEKMQALLWDCQCGAPVHAFVVNYEALAQTAWQRWEAPHKIDVIIYDEAHKLKQYREKTKPSRLKGPHEKALGPGATPEEVKQARRLDEVGPRESALAPDASRSARLVARAQDKAERRRIDEERANRLTVSGVAHRWVAWSHRRFALTGTPFPQHPWDIFGLYRAIDPGVFGEVWTDFRDEFVKLNKGGTFPVKIRPDKLEEFAARAMSLMYRPKVDLNLPGCTDVTRVLELEDSARKVYDQLDTQLWADLAELARQRRADGAAPVGAVADVEVEPGDLEDAADGRSQLTARNLLARLLRLQQLTGGTLRPDPTRDRHGRPVPGPEVRVSTVKADALAEFAAGELTGGILDEIGCVPGRVDQWGRRIDPEPLVVFTRFTSDLDAVRAVVERAGLRYGEISGRRADGLDTNARMSPDVDVVGVNIQAGGTGIDLTRSRYAVWYSLGYSVSDCDQARARLYRPGQTRPVVNIHLVCAGTKDQAVYAAIRARRDAVAAVMRAGGVDPSELGVVEESPGPDPTADPVEGLDSGGAAVELPWEK